MSVSHLFQKGKSGNPFGGTSRLNKLTHAMREQCAEIAFGALGVLASIIHDPNEKGSTRVSAWNSVADRGLGKAVQTLIMDNDNELKDPRTMTTPELNSYLANDAINTFVSMYQRGEPMLLEALNKLRENPEKNEPIEAPNTENSIITSAGFDVKLDKKNEEIEK